MEKRNETWHRLQHFFGRLRRGRPLESKQACQSHPENEAAQVYLIRQIKELKVSQVAKIRIQCDRMEGPGEPNELDSGLKIL